MFELSIISDFAAAHSLPDYDGPCKNLHGHTWKVEVTLEREQLDDKGMVVDFRVIKKQLKEFLLKLDHQYLNDLPEFKDLIPTTDNLAKYIYKEFSQVCKPIKIKSVRVWESETASVTYYE